jgi:hypothetical protein
LKVFYYLNNLGIIENQNINNTFVTIFNHGKRDFKIKRGDNLLKLIIGKNIDSIPYEIEQPCHDEMIIKPKIKKVCIKNNKSETKPKTTHNINEPTIMDEKPGISANNIATTSTQPISQPKTEINIINYKTIYLRLGIILSYLSLK